MKFIRKAAVVLVALLLAGCSPEYNWREVAVGGDVGLVLFPDKPRTQTKSLDFAGHEVQFSLTTAEIGKTIFAVGQAPWPESMADDEATRQELGRAVIASLYRNLGADMPAEPPEFGQRFEASAKPSGGMMLQAQVWVSDTGLVEGIVMGPAGSFPRDSAAEFLASLGKGR